MDEVLKRRLLGALALLLGALLLASLLPEPGGPQRVEPGQKLVTVDLKAPPPAPLAAPEEPVPALDQVVTSKPAPEPEPDAVEAPAPPPAAPVAEKKPEKPAKPETPQAPAAPLPRPELKMESTLASRSATAPAKPEARAPASGEPGPKTAAAEKPAAKPQASKPWYVQAGSYNDIANARQALSQLEAAGFKAVIAPAETSGGTRYRVRTGPFPTREEADKQRVQLGKKGIIGATAVQD